MSDNFDPFDPVNAAMRHLHNQNLLAAEQAKNARLKAEVERLTALKDACKRMIKRRDKWIYEHRSIRKQLEAEIERLKSLCDCLGMGGKHTITEIEAENARLKAEVERLDTLCKQLMAQHSDISCENIMLRKAGDEMASTLKDGGIIVSGYALADEWLKAKLLAAKEGKQSNG